MRVKCVTLRSSQCACANCARVCAVCVVCALCKTAQHSWGNTLRLLKLPFIFLDRSGTMYAGAIAQFYFLTKHLEHALALNSSHPVCLKSACFAARFPPVPF